MGDSRRFRLMARLVAEHYPDYQKRELADIAGGKGYLRAALRQIGFRHVTTIDKRDRLAKGRPGQEYALFRYDSRKRFALVLGMHPDEATDHIILYASRHHIPFVVCPCCLKPDASVFEGRTFDSWVYHLHMLANPTHSVEFLELPMSGKNLVLIGDPK